MLKMSYNRLYRSKYIYFDIVINEIYEVIEVKINAYKINIFRDI